MEIKIRLAQDEDYKFILDIWIEGISTSFTKYEIENPQIFQNFKSLFEKRSGIFNFWVYIIENDIVGWYSFSKCSSNPITSNSFAELSLYIKTENRDTGVGTILTKDAISIANKSLLQYIFVFVAKNNLYSRKLVNRFEFLELGSIPISDKGTGSKELLQFVKLV